MTASSLGMTTPSTTVAGMSGYVAPPPGLTPPDFSSWRLPPPEALPSGGLPTAPQGLPGVGRSLMMRAWLKGMLRHRWHRVQAVWPKGPRHSPRWCSACPKWHLLSANHYLADQLPCTDRRYSHQVRLRGEELLQTPVSIKLPLPVVKAPRTTGDLQLEGGETVADLSVTPQGCRRR